MASTTLRDSPPDSPGPDGKGPDSNGQDLVIRDTDALEVFCAELAGADFLAVDTEFMRDTTYWPKLCLIQIAGPAGVRAIDCLAPGLDLAPLFGLMVEESLPKVFHAARQDLEIFFHLTGAVPHPVFDTQVAAMVCGFGEQISYENLARQLAKARIDKASRFSDWTRRPLPRRQLDYALSDVIHLRTIYEKIRGRLDKNGRRHWLDEEMALLSDPETYRLEPDRAWRRLKTRSGDRRYLAILYGLAAWREAEAQRRDVPRNRVLRDEQLYDIAGRAPQSAEELAHTRGLDRSLARGRIGTAILGAVAEAKALDKAALPEPPPRSELPSGLTPIVDLLKVLLKARCEQHDVAQKLVASSADLEQLAADDAAPIPALHGWRHEVFGQDALALKHGRLAIAVRDRKTVLVPLEAEAGD